MKLFTLFAIVIFSVPMLINAQIPNADFENWTNGSPNSWLTNNEPPLIIAITQTTDAQSGASAVKGEVISSMGMNLPPFLFSEATDAVDGFSITQRYSSVKGFYKFTPVQDDSMLIGVFMYKNGNTVGVGTAWANPVSNYTQFTANITYITNDIPDTCLIIFSILNNNTGPLTVHPGSAMYIDNLSFGNVTAVNNQSIQPISFKLFQNYPNPFNPTTKIKYSLSSSGFVTLNIYNMLGKKVKSLVNNNQSRGTYEVTADLSSDASGIYFYRIAAKSENGKEFTSIKKMILMK